MAATSPSATPQLGGLLGWVVDVIDALGAFGVGVLVLAETVFPPIPSEVVLPLAGFLAGQGRMSLAAVVLLATVGSVLGALHEAGARLGAERLRAAFDRLPLVSAADVDAAQAWFDRHGSWSVLLGRLVPGVRSLVSVPAGVARMPRTRFLALTLVGSATWNAVFVVLGYELGHRWQAVGEHSDRLNAAAYALLACGVVALVVRRVRRARPEADG